MLSPMPVISLITSSACRVPITPAAAPSTPASEQLGTVPAGGTTGRLKVSVVTGDVRPMHQAPQYAGALFQVASQFNALDMTSYEVTPEHGVTRYEGDHAQGRRGRAYRVHAGAGGEADRGHQPEPGCGRQPVNVEAGPEDRATAEIEFPGELSDAFKHHQMVGNDVL